MPQATVRAEFVSANASITPIVQPGLGFNVAIADDFTYSDSSRFKSYSSSADAAADSDLTSFAKAAITDIFAQSPRPSSVIVISVDETGSSEAVDVALADAEDDGANWVYTLIWSRADPGAGAPATEAASFVASRRKILCLQSDDSGWLTTSVPAAFSSLTTNDNVAVLYHDDDAEPAAEAWFGRMAGVNPDVQAPSFEGPVSSVEPYSITSAQRAFALANFCNVLIPLDDTTPTRYLRSGVNLAGESLYARIAKFWFEDRWETAIMQRYAEFAATSRKFPLNGFGEQIALAEAWNVVENGLLAGHFTKRADLPDGASLSVSIDLSAKSITLTGQIGLLDSVQSVSATVNLTRGA